MMTRRFALVVGIIYLVIGIAGFIPGLVQGQDYPDLAVDAGSGALLGLFPVNVVHHLVHLLVGVLGIAAYRALHRPALCARAGDRLGRTRGDGADQRGQPAHHVRADTPL